MITYLQGYKRNEVLLEILLLGIYAIKIIIVWTAKAGKPAQFYTTQTMYMSYRFK